MITINQDVLSNVNRGFHIPAKPEILSQIQSKILEEDSSLVDIADLISQDVELAAAVLKTINSPFYGLNRAISDIKQAAFMLGFDNLNTLVTGLLFKKAFSQESCISLERFWDDSVDVASAMTFIGNRFKDKVPQEDLYILGMFRNCGIPAMAQKFPDYKDTLIQINSAPDKNQNDVEMKKYATNHSIVGYYIAATWHLPKNICNLILQHHELDYLDEIKDSSDQIAFATLKACENIIDRNKRFYETTGWSTIKGKVFDVLGITEFDYQDIEEELAAILDEKAAF